MPYDTWYLIYGDDDGAGDDGAGDHGDGDHGDAE